ncbi:MAG: hypothetical protein ABDI20_08595 [Candidatus Bipolaricaulaceae bacterium]
MRERREREREERLAQARAFAEAVAQALGPLSAWVYGSVARSDFHSPPTSTCSLWLQSFRPTPCAASSSSTNS